MKYLQNLDNHIIPAPLSLKYLSDKAIDLSDFALESTVGAEFVAELLNKKFQFSGNNSKVLKLILNKNLADDEEYCIYLNNNGGVIEFASYRAGLYAVETMKQLAVGNCVFPCEIADKPQLKMRGISLCLQNLRHADVNDVLYLIEMMGKFKLNTLLLEYGQRFPFINGHEVLRTPGSFSEDDVKKIEEKCRELDIEVIPLIQCLGHNGYIGIHEEYQHLFEPGAKFAGDLQLCPLKQESFELFAELATQIMNAHPNGKYFHIGADEVRSLGNCPDCAEFAEKYGKNQLYIDYVNKACDWVIKQQRIPIVWDDMLGHYPEILPFLNKKAIIMYWDYWAIKETSPFWVGRMGNNFQIADKNIDAENFDSAEKKILDAFAKKVDMQEFLAQDKVKEFKKYLGDEIPKRFSSFPFYKFYQDMGFQVIGVPSALGDPDDDENGMPNFVRSLENIRAFADKCKKENSMGMITSSWHNFPHEILLTGIMQTAQNCWKK